MIRFPLFFVYFLSQFALAQTQAPTLPTVSSVDLNKYIGLWYEIASIPQNFQKKCIKNTKANYEFSEHGRVAVENSCEMNNGEISVAHGQAKVVDVNTNAKLKVTFVKLIDWIFTFGGDYWIIDLGGDYEYAVVGHPDRTYGWILSRKSFLGHDTLVKIEHRLKKNGYDTCLFMTSIQDGGNGVRQPLCEAVK